MEHVSYFFDRMVVIDAFVYFVPIEQLSVDHRVFVAVAPEGVVYIVHVSEHNV